MVLLQIYRKNSNLILEHAFDVFKEKNINYTIKELNKPEEVILLVQDMEDPKASVDSKKQTKNSNQTEAKS